MGAHSQLLTVSITFVAVQLKPCSMSLLISQHTPCPLDTLRPLRSDGVDRGQRRSQLQPEHAHTNKNQPTCFWLKACE